MEQNRKSTPPWNFTKGMALSYSALATTLIKSGAITATDLISDLDEFIKLLTDDDFSSSADFLEIEEVAEVLRMNKSSIMSLFPEDESSPTLDSVWVSDFIGNA